MEDKRTVSIIKEFESVVVEAKQLHQKYGVASRTDNLVLKTLEKAEESVKKIIRNGCPDEICFLTDSKEDKTCEDLHAKK